ncbi:MAG: hypothetical protein V1754_04235 [Pseudomonadota bacterium]
MMEFTEGHRLTNKGGFLFNMAECARMLQEKQRAHKLYMLYLREYKDGQNREQALKQCQELEVGSCDVSASTEAAESEAGTQRPALTPSTDVSEPKPYMPSKTKSVSPVQSAGQKKGTPFYKHWAFWTGVGAVLVAGTVTAIAVGASGSGTTLNPEGDYTLIVNAGQ